MIKEDEATVPLGKEIKVMKKNEITSSGVKATRFHVEFEQPNSEEDETDTENLNNKKALVYNVTFSVYER